MSKNRLSTSQIVWRTLFMLIAVGLVSWFFPHNEAFRYEYEVGKPWRYGRLTAPYDFAIYRSDSVIMQMEDSLQRQIVPRYMVDVSVAESALRSLSDSRYHLSSGAQQQLRELVSNVYLQGVVTGEERDRLDRLQMPEAILKLGNQANTVPASQLLSERQAYEMVHNDSVYAREFSQLPLQRVLRTNLEPDTTAMRLEYARLRQQVSSTSGTVLAESRIIDNGEIVTPRTFDILESYRREQQLRMGLTADETLTWVGRVLLVALILCSVLFFFALYREWIHLRQTEVFVAIGSVVFMVIFTSLANSLIVGGAYLVPIGIATILVSTFHGSRSAYYCHIVMVLLCSFIAPSHFEYLVIQCIIGMIIVFSLKDGLQVRSQLMHVSCLCAVGYTGIYALYTLATEGSLANISWPILAMMVVNAILLLTSYLIIYAMEKLFGFMSGVTLSEMSNLDGILLRMQQEANGTFQHCTNMANIAGDAAKQIGANIQLVRTGALYHDIGKLWAPEYYTENQRGENPHDKLTLEESVERIKRHVAEGVAMAEKAKMPREIIEFIQTHHGRSQVKYFYIKWCNEHPDETPDMDFFSYAGPDPITKEQTILMMADSIEAASRSMEDYSIENITRRVNTIIDDLIASGRLNSSKITFREIQLCRESFIQSIASINHTRIAYPELKRKL